MERFKEFKVCFLLSKGRELTCKAFKNNPVLNWVALDGGDTAVLSASVRFKGSFCQLPSPQHTDPADPLSFTTPIQFTPWPILEFPELGINKIQHKCRNKGSRVVFNK